MKQHYDQQSCDLSSPVINSEPVKTGKGRLNGLIAITVAAFLIAACGRPINITANPDDHTNTSGTLGSARMTNELPRKSDNMKIPDSIRRTNDSLPRY